MTRSVTARWAAGAGLLCAAALISACGSAGNGGSGAGPSASSPSTSASASTSGSASASPSVPAPGSGGSGAQAAGCASSVLKITVDTSQGGAAAGSTYYPIDFTNSSGGSCTLFGFPGASFVTGPSGGEVGQPADRNNSAAGTTVTLPPGGSAHAVLQVVDAGNYSAADCHPVTVHWLRVYPPGQTVPLYATFKSQTCSANLPRKLGSPLSIYPVRGGEGKPGQAP